MLFTIIKHYQMFQVAKLNNQNTSLYKTLLVSLSPWEDANMVFVLSVARTQRNEDSIMIVLDMFSKMGHLGPCNRTNDASQVVHLYFMQVV